jgi:serine/threonine-protein phosphatase 2B catalytic subunit
LVFLGDYVDRGINAVEVTILLMCLKIEYPFSIFLLRGNHESRIMTAQYNFRSECCLKYSQDVYDLMMDAFNLLPIACVVNHSYFCVHGGISDKMLDVVPAPRRSTRSIPSHGR